VVGGVSILVSLNALSNLVIALTLVCEGIAAFLVWRQGYRAARLYLVSWVLMLLAGLTFVLSNLNILSGLAIPESIVMVATAMGSLFWSLAIADRVNLLKAETESAISAWNAASGSIAPSLRIHATPSLSHRAKARLLTLILRALSCSALTELNGKKSMSARCMPSQQSVSKRPGH